MLTGFQQVEDALADLRILAQEAEIVDRAVDAAQQSLDISTTQYRGGLANYLQVITAQTSLLQNQRATVDLLTRRLVASVSLIQALGGGWDVSQLPTDAGGAALRGPGGSELACQTADDGTSCWCGCNPPGPKR